MYVIFEGVDTSGKSTQIDLFNKNYQDIIVTKEPGGTKFGVHVREMILHSKEPISKEAEMFLFLADRAEHYKKIVQPNKNKVVLSDRGFISGMAYALVNDQNIDEDILLKMNMLSLNGTLPEKIVFLKTNETLLKKRLHVKTHDIIEKRGISYLMSVQEKMEQIIQKIDTKTLIVDASLEIQNIYEKIQRFIYD